MSVAYIDFYLVSSAGEVRQLLPQRVYAFGRGDDVDFQIQDTLTSRRHCELRWDDQAFWTLVDLKSRNGTYVNGERVHGRSKLADGDKIQVGRTTILKFTYHDTLEESFQKQMYESALRDGLTKVYNKRYFAERLISEMRFAVRHQAAIALLMLDLDHFKNINDTHGHVAGDRVLAAVAQTLSRSVRNEDVVARYGGEEFAVLLRSTPYAHVLNTAERLRKQIEALMVENEGGQVLGVTVSIGLATFPETKVTTPAEMVEAADQALYRAKHAGRNRVSV